MISTPPPPRKPNHLKTSSIVVDVQVPPSPGYSSYIPASPDTAAVFSIGVKVGKTNYTVRNSTATSGGILVTLEKLWKQYQEDRKALFQSVEETISEADSHASRSGIESFYLALMLWKSSPEKSLTLFHKAEKQEPGSKLMHLFHPFMKKKFEELENRKDKSAEGKLKSGSDQDFPGVARDNTEWIIGEKSDTSHAKTFIHHLDFSPFLSAPQICRHARRIIRFCETNVQSLLSPRGSLSNSPSRLADTCNVGRLSLHSLRSQDGTSGLDLVRTSPSSYKLKLSHEKSKQNKKSFCVFMSGGEYEVLQHLLSSMEQKEGFSYSSIHIITSNKKACDQLLKSLVSKYNGKLPCPIFTSSTFSGVTHTYDVGAALFSVDLMSSNTREACLKWMSTHCHYVIFGVFDIPDVVGKCTNKDVEGVLEPARVGHLVQCFEYGLQKKHLDSSFNLCQSEDGNLDTEGKPSAEEVTDAILDLLYKILLPKDPNIPKQNRSNVSDMDKNSLSLTTWLDDIQRHGFCIEKQEHVYNHWWAPVFLIWGSNISIPDQRTLTNTIYPSDLYRDSTQQ